MVILTSGIKSTALIIFIDKSISRSLSLESLGECPDGRCAVDGVSDVSLDWVGGRQVAGEETRGGALITQDLSFNWNIKVRPDG